MASQDDVRAILQAGIAAARAGDRATARKHFERVVHFDDGNEAAWMWLASLDDSVEQRKGYLEKVLRINPNNERAREALTRLSGVSSGDADSQAIDRLRRIQRRRETSELSPVRQTASDDGFSVGYALLVAVIVLVVVSVIIFAVVRSQETTSGPSVSTIRAVEAVVNATETPTINPRTFTATPVFGVIVAEPSNAPTLPPTFTATPLPTEAPTLRPSPTPLALSDFSMVYSSLNPGEANASLFSALGDGSQAQRFGDSELGFHDVAVSPSGDKIAFVRVVITTTEDDEGVTEVTAQELFVAPANNPDAAQQITIMGSNSLSNPAWAPDSLGIAFVSDFDDDEDIWFITDDGENLRKITDNVAIDSDPVWLIDGSKIIFASDLDSPGFTEIYSMNPDGTQVTRLTDDSGSSFQPAVSPDGTRITFVSDRQGDGDIFIMDSDGQRPFLVTADDGGAEDRFPVFTPDNRWIVFSSNREDGTFQLYAIDLRGDVLVRLTSDGREALSADFRP